MKKNKYTPQPTLPLLVPADFREGWSETVHALRRSPTPEKAAAMLRLAAATPRLEEEDLRNMLLAAQELAPIDANILQGPVREPNMVWRKYRVPLPPPPASSNMTMDDSYRFGRYERRGWIATTLDTHDWTRDEYEDEDY